MVETKSAAAKLRIRPGDAVWVSEPSRVGVLGPLPAGARVVARIGDARVAVALADDAAAIRAVLAADGHALAGVEAFWVAYPKANRTDINRDSLWPILAGHGFRPVSQVAIDETWSALRFRVLRTGEAPFAGGA
jgi:hypothetical protein